MGSSSSSSNKKIRCSYCTCHPYKIISGTNQRQVQVENGIPICPRCEGYVYKKPRGNQSHNVPPEILEANRVRPLAYIRLSVFQTSLSVCDEANPTADIVRDQYLTPYFEHLSHPVPLRSGMRIQANGLDFKIISTHPPEGIVTSNTVILCNQNNDLSIIDDETPLEAVHILPMDATVNSNTQDLFETHVRPWLRADPDLILREGEVFVSQNVQFKVCACRPVSGRITPDVEIHTNGQRFADLQRVKLVPVYETLPNREKNIRPRDIKERYLNSYLLGSFCYLRRDQEIEIMGVKFAVMECQPPEGYITCLTEIQSHEPISSERLRTHQLERDEAFARHLQQEENANTRNNFLVNRRLQGGVPQLNARQQEVLQNHLHNLILTMHQQQPRGNGPPRMPELNQLFEQLREAQNRPTGLTTQQISMLPTRVYKAPQNDDFDDNEIDPNDDRFTCRICLMNYEDGDLLRTLSCFHSYHADCIDRWLQTSTTCPICRSDSSHL